MRIKRLYLAVICMHLVVLGNAGTVSSATMVSANYAGSGWIDTGIDQPLPNGVSVTTCDNAGLLDTGIRGIGAVMFCNVPKDATLHVDVYDHIHASVGATLTCYRADTLNYWSFATFQDNTQAILPSWCGQHLTDDPDTTRVTVYINGPPDGLGGTLGIVRLIY